MTCKEDRLIHTLGTSTRSAEEFLNLLAVHGVELIIDVRRFPTSRYEHFGQEKLKGLLSDNGVEYIHMGRELGGYRQGGYQNFTKTPGFQRRLKKLEDVANNRRAAIICAELLPWRCHRRFIAQELGKRGWQVNHIIDRDRNWSPGQ
ncbi:MAG: DUF488 domain-containing protein [Dehalococcoidia bacterium]|nr:MAG: DUF488 domain-containing protein [Dehalococcoidia bacterium]